MSTTPPPMSPPAEPIEDQSQISIAQPHSNNFFGGRTQVVLRPTFMQTIEDPAPEQIPKVSKKK